MLGPPRAVYEEGPTGHNLTMEVQMAKKSLKKGKKLAGAKTLRKAGGTQME